MQYPHQIDQSIGRNELTKRKKRKKADVVDMQDSEIDLEYINSIVDISKETKANIRLIEDLGLRFVETNDTKKQDTLKEKIKTKIEEVKDQIQQANRKSELIKTRIKDKMKAENDPQMKNSVTRFQFTFSNTLQSQIVKLVMSFGQVQSRMKELYQKKALEQLKLDNPNVDQRKLQEYIQNPDIMEQAMMEMGGTKQKLANALKDIKKKVSEIGKIEERVVGLFEMIKEVQTVISAQGLAIDSIVASVDAIHDHVQKAHDDIKEGGELSISIQEVF